MNNPSVAQRDPFPEQSLHPTTGVRDGLRSTDRDGAPRWGRGLNIAGTGGVASRPPSP